MLNVGTFKKSTFFRFQIWDYCLHLSLKALQWFTICGKSPPLGLTIGWSETDLLFISLLQMVNRYTAFNDRYTIYSAGCRGVRTVPLNQAPKFEGPKILKNKQMPMQCELKKMFWYKKNKQFYLSISKYIFLRNMKKEGAHWSFSNRVLISCEPALGIYNIWCFFSFYRWEKNLLYLLLHLLIQISAQNHNCNALNVFFTVLSHNNVRSGNGKWTVWERSEYSMAAYVTGSPRVRQDNTNISKGTYKFDYNKNLSEIFL